MPAGASPMSPLGCGARHGACQREVRGGAPGTRRVERPSLSFLAPRAGAVRGRFRPTAPAGAVRAPLRAGSSWTHTTRSRGARGAGARPGRRRRGRARRGRARKGAAFGSGRRGVGAAALHGSRRRGPPPLAVTPRESPARRVPAAEGGLRATPHRGRSQAKRAWPDAVQLCPSRRQARGGASPPSGAGEAGPAAQRVGAAPKASCGGEGPYTETGLRVDQCLATPAASDAAAVVPGGTVRAGGAGDEGVSRGDAVALRARPAPRTKTRTTRAMTGARSGAHRAPPWPAGRVASRAPRPQRGSLREPWTRPVLGPSSSIGEMASHLPAWGDDEKHPEKDRGAPESAPRRSDQTIHECRHGPERPGPERPEWTRPREDSSQ